MELGSIPAIKGSTNNQSGNNNMINRGLKLVPLFLLLGCAQVSAKSLIFSYWIQAHPPFAIQKDDQIVGGLIKDLGDEIAERLGYEARYERFPVLRVEQNLIEGNVHLTCITSPIWQQKADQYEWSPEMFKGQDRFLVKSGEENDIADLDALKGKTVGVYHDYIYHRDIMSKLESKEADRLVVRDIETAIKLIRMGRIDTFIEFGSVLSYELKKAGMEDLSLASKPADEFSLHCSYSPKMPVPKKEVDRVINSMVEDGSIEKTLNQYR